MSSPRPITETERESKSRSVDRAWLRWLEKHDPPQADKFLKFYYADGQPDWCVTLFRFRLGRLALSSEKLKFETDAARERGDAAFFNALASVIRLGVFFHPEMNRTERFLLTGWDAPQNGCPELFYFTPEALAALCRAVGMDAATPAMITKARQRLGLEPFKRCKLRLVKRDGVLEYAPVQRFRF